MTPYGGLANRCLQPLGHPSAWRVIPGRTRTQRLRVRFYAHATIWSNGTIARTGYTAPSVTGHCFKSMRPSIEESSPLPGRTAPLSAPHGSRLSVLLAEDSQAQALLTRPPLTSSGLAVRVVLRAASSDHNGRDRTRNGRTCRFRRLQQREVEGSRVVALALRMGFITGSTPSVIRRTFSPKPRVIPAGRTFDSRLSGRPAGMILISRAAATPTLRAYQSPVEATGIRVPAVSAAWGPRSV